MATHEIGILGPNTFPDTTVYQDRISNQLSLTNTSIGNLLAFVLVDGAADLGVWGVFTVPQNYVGTPVLVIRGILDGAPAAAGILGFGFTGLPLADNEAADAAFTTEDIASATIGSNGSNHSDEDLYEETITLTNLGTLAPGDQVFFHAYRDDNVTTYAGNFLMTSLNFRYNDA